MANKNKRSDKEKKLIIVISLLIAIPLLVGSIMSIANALQEEELLDELHICNLKIREYEFIFEIIDKEFNVTAQLMTTDITEKHNLKGR